MYTSSSGGGNILQRFGSPDIYVDNSTDSTHTFGYTEQDYKKNGGQIKGLHNIYYTTYPSGRETLTIFINKLSNYSYSAIIEFDLKLTPEREGKQYKQASLKILTLLATLSLPKPEPKSEVAEPDSCPSLPSVTPTPPSLPALVHTPLTLPTLLTAST